MQHILRSYSRLIWIVPLTLTGFAVLFAFDRAPLAGAIVMVGLGLGVACLKWPNLATLAVIFAIYLNVPAVAARSHDVPKIVAASVGLLLLVPLSERLIVKREAIIFDRIFQLMLVYLAAMLTSTIFAKDLNVAAHSMADFVFEGIVIYFLVSNLIRDLPTLKRVIAVVLLAGSLMGGLSIIQKATHTADNDYAGFAQTGGVFGVGMQFGKQALQVRSEGPIGEVNRYAQVLLVLVPLAFALFLKGKSRLWRFAGASAAALLIGGIALTYSRGAFLGLVVITLLAVGMRYIKVHQLVLPGIAVAAVFLLTSSELTTRLDTLEHIPALLFGQSSKAQAADESMRRRLAENIAALQVFMDHPLTGVGPGHFAPYYSTPYVVRSGLASQEKGYFAHNCYLQIAADTGAFGLFSFLAIVGVLMHGLWSRWRRWRHVYSDLALLSAAFFISGAAYLVTAVFLQMAYQRYFWLLVALASATMHVTDQEAQKRDSFAEQSAESAVEGATPPA